MDYLKTKRFLEQMYISLHFIIAYLGGATFINSSRGNSTPSISAAMQILSCPQDRRSPTCVHVIIVCFLFCIDLQCIGHTNNALAFEYVYVPSIYNTWCGQNCCFFHQLLSQSLLSVHSFLATFRHFWAYDFWAISGLMIPINDHNIQIKVWDNYNNS